jgi:hypothetical protein
MKPLRVLAMILAAAAALSSCFWVGNLGTGEVQMDLSGVHARAGDTVRVYLLADDLLFSTGGGVPFAAEAPVAISGESRIKIEGLPVGPTYRALVGLGNDTAGLWIADQYGESSQFLVSPTAETEVVISNLGSNWPYYAPVYSSELMGKSLKGVAPAGSDVYTAEERTMYLAYFDPFGALLSISDQYDLAADPNVDGVSDRRVLGLSDDPGFLANDAFLNSDSGIIPFSGGDGWSFDPSFSTGLNGTRAIIETGTFFVVQDQALFFRRADGLGGKYFPFSPPDGPWVNLDVAGVRDMAVSENYAYFATDGGNFALPPAFLQDSTPTLAEHRIAFSAPAEVLCLGFKPAGGFPGGTLSMGTTDGVWEVTVDESSGVAMGTATQIPETEGERIEMIAISSYSDYAAYISRYFLFIRYKGVIYKFPFFAVIPGKATGMVFENGGWSLFISGFEGLSAIYLGS